MNSRLDKIIKEKGKYMAIPSFIDCYNQQIFPDIVPTITTRVDSSCLYFVAVEDENKER